MMITNIVVEEVMTIYLPDRLWSKSGTGGSYTYRVSDYLLDDDNNDDNDDDDDDGNDADDGKV